MQVFLLEWRDFEETLIMGVYSSEAAAEQGRARCVAKHPNDLADEYDIKEFEVED